jgi:pyoverdine/dityrosine biosynthesis protein Dit1
MTGYKFERLDKDDCALLIIDHQVGLSLVVHDIQADQFRTSILAHAAIGKLFNLPTVMTTSTETG